MKKRIAEGEQVNRNRRSIENILLKDICLLEESNNGSSNGSCKSLLVERRVYLNRPYSFRLHVARLVLLGHR